MNPLGTALVLLLFGCQGQAPTPRSGVLDLREEGLRPGVALKGHWAELPGYSTPLQAEAPFEGRWPRRDGVRAPHIGGRLELRLPEASAARPPALHLRSVCAPFELRVLDSAGVPVMKPIVGGELDPPVRTNFDRVIPLPAQRDLILELRSADAECRSADPKLVVGDRAALDAEVAASRQESWMVAGVMLITGLYHLLLYGLRRTERAPLWLGLFGLSMAVRLWSRYEGLEVRLPGFDDHALHVGLEFASFYLTVPLFAAYLHELLPNDMPKWVAKATAVGMGGLCLALWFGPRAWSYLTLGAAEYITLAVAPLAVWAVLRAWWLDRDREVLRWVLAGTALLIGFSVLQIVSNRVNYAPLPMEQWAVASFVFCQSAVLAVLNGRARRQAEALAIDLVHTNAALARFVPAPLLRMLGKPDLTRLALGDQVEREITVLFCDIRGFTALSEGLNARQTFELLNRCLQRVAPIVREHNGFIDKYIGDAIMALFPGKPEDAVRAAIAITAALAELPDQPRIRMGFGIHTGPVMLGMIGEAARMEGTVIADAVNLSARLEGLSAKLGADILVSEETWLRTPPGLHPHRSIGRVRVSGKLQSVGVVELGRSGPPELDEALTHVRAGRIAEARSILERLRQSHPDDGVIRAYAQACARGDGIERDGALRIDK